MSEQQLSLFEKLKSFQRKKTNKSPKKSKKRSQGDKVEQIACDYLQKHGLTLIEKNFSTKAGEVDLIMRDDKDVEMLVFIEVRYRKNKDFGGAAASVTTKKQRRIIKAALAYQQHNAPQSSMRFDVIAVEGDNVDQNIEIDWIVSAFDGF